MNDEFLKELSVDVFLFDCRADIVHIEGHEMDRICFTCLQKNILMALKTIRDQAIEEMREALQEKYTFKHIERDLQEAIKVERERCARIAETYKKESSDFIEAIPRRIGAKIREKK